MLQDLLQEVPYGRCAGVEVGLGVVVEQREPDGLVSVEAGLYHGPDGAAIYHIDGGVAAVVDARKDKVGFAGAEVFNTHLDAIGRHAVAGVDAQPLFSAHSLYAKGTGAGDGSTHPRGIALGSHDHHIPILLGHSGQMEQPS